MRLLRISEVEVEQNDRVFRHARMRALILWLAAFCADAVMFFSALPAIGSLATSLVLHCYCFSYYF